MTKAIKIINKALKKLGFTRRQRNKVEFKLFRSFERGKVGVVIDIPLGKNAD